MTKEEEKKEDEDYDFDFSEYENEEKEEESIETIHKDKPNITGLRSRFSYGEILGTKLINIEQHITKYSIKVGARTQSLPELWTFYSIVDEYWDNIRHIFGKVINDEMNEIKKNCRRLLDESKNTTIQPKVHYNLLNFKSKVYQIAQLGNFRFEVERINRGAFSSAQRKINQ
jgi:hypothetical protein